VIGDVNNPVNKSVNSLVNDHVLLWQHILSGINSHQLAHLCINTLSYLASIMYGILAELMVALHVAYVGYIVVGQMLIVIGSGVGWQWVRNPWFRFSHLIMMGIVCVEEMMGWRCPLTIWENDLRILAGQTVAQGSFMGRFLHDLLYVNDVLPEKAIQILHLCFGVIVLQALIMCPPRWFGRTPPSA
jgi:hypothetical protein